MIDVLISSILTLWKKRELDKVWSSITAHQIRTFNEVISRYSLVLNIDRSADFAKQYSYFANTISIDPVSLFARKISGFSRIKKWWGNYDVSSEQILFHAYIDKNMAEYITIPINKRAVVDMFSGIIPTMTTITTITQPLKKCLLNIPGYFYANTDNSLIEIEIETEIINNMPFLIKRFFSAYNTYDETIQIDDFSHIICDMDNFNRIKDKAREDAVFMVYLDYLPPSLKVKIDDTIWARTYRIFNVLNIPVGISMPSSEYFYLLFPPGVFYEFLPANKFSGVRTGALPLWEITTNTPYLFVLTTTWGLFRVSSSKVIKFVSLNPPIFEPLPQKDFLSFMGEMITLPQIERALQEACFKSSAVIHKWHVATAPSLNDKWKLLFLIAFESSPSDTTTFAEIIDNKLQSLNPGYAKYRKNLYDKIQVITLTPEMLSTMNFSTHILSEEETPEQLLKKIQDLQ